MFTGLIYSLPLLFACVWFVYLLFDLFLRRWLVEHFSDKIRTVKRYYGYSTKYWTQGRVLGFWIDYEYTKYDSQIQTNVDALVTCIQNRNKKQEIMKEYDV